MSRHFAVLGKIPPVGEYSEMIQRLFQGRPAVVAIIGTGFGNGITSICEGVASELSHLGKRVVLVSVTALLHANPLALSNETAVSPEVGRNVWLWPSPVGQPIEFLNSGDLRATVGAPKSATPLASKNWLDSLRQNFDSVLLDCPPLETAPRGAAVAAMAEAAVLVVDGTRSSKHQIMLDQRMLQLSGVKLAGCILINAK